MFRARNLWWHRSLTALLSVWFLVVSSEIGAVDGCSMHRAAATESNEVSAEMSMHHRHDAGHTTTNAHTQSHDHQHAKSHQCTCIGTCCSITTPLATTIVAVTSAAPAVIATPSIAGIPALLAVHWIGFILPFATAPPAALS